MVTGGRRRKAFYHASVMVMTLSCGPRVSSTVDGDDSGDAVSGTSTTVDGGVTEVASIDGTSGDTAPQRAVVDLFAGHFTTCALFDSGEARCWGNSRIPGDPEKMWGDDEPADAAPLLPIADPIASLILPHFSTCALLAAGSVTCWGANEWGQLGAPGEPFVGDDEPIGGPIELDGEAVAITGDWSTCVAFADGRMRCFGENGKFGNLGFGNARECFSCIEASDCCLGDDESVLAEEALAFDEAVVAISAGSVATCAVMASGALRCWGGVTGYPPAVGLPGQTLGDDERATEGEPIDVGGLVLQVATSSAHTCAVLDGGIVRCWGRDENGAIGTLETLGDDEPPAVAPPLPLPGPAVEVDVGANHSCARLTDGSVWCWGTAAEGAIGHPGAGNLGDDEPIDALGPVDLGGTAVRVVTGESHSCALLASGAVRCWGSNTVGQLGYGHTEAIGDDETPAAAGDVPVD